MNLYGKLAMSGIRKNQKLYYPYIITCICMVMMLYITAALARDPYIRSTRGGSVAQIMINLGVFVIGTFSLLFLAYSNAFIIKRRNKEFGLYNVLGMNKKNILKILSVEYIFTSVFTIISGLFLGIVLYKFANLSFLHIVGEKVNYELTIDWLSVRNTAIIFLVVYFLLYIVNVIRILRTDTLSLVKAERLGEIPPKANYIPALIGIVMLVSAYIIAVRIKNPVSVVELFFVAVIMVIISTYLIMISGSVALCRFLKNRKEYYYKKNHFISVSGMFFRMKHNGAGLASICILSTMVLVMLFSTVSLYIGAEDSVRNMYPQNINISVTYLDDESFNNADTIGAKEKLDAVIEYNGATVEEERVYKYCSFVGSFSESQKEFKFLPTDMLDGFAQYFEVIVITSEDYVKQGGEPIIVKPGECFFYSDSVSIKSDSINFGDVSLKVAGTVKDTLHIKDLMVSIVPTLCIVVNDYDEILPLFAYTDNSGSPIVSKTWSYGVDISKQDDVVSIYNQMLGNINPLKDELPVRISSGCRDVERADFYSTFGSFFFLGILLSIVFSFACVLIIYYKQITEGYMDQNRFAIMKKVGMTDKDIRSSINNQILTVFFAPLIMAGVHICFAFPMVWRMLKLFGFFNLKLIIIVTALTYLCYAVLYCVIYKITAHSYYKIVNSEQ